MSQVAPPLESHYSRTCEAPTELLQQRMKISDDSELKKEIQAEISRRAGLQKDCHAIRQKRAIARREKQQETARQQLMHSGDTRQIR